MGALFSGRSDPQRLQARESDRGCGKRMVAAPAAPAALAVAAAASGATRCRQGTDTMTFQDDELSYALGKQASASRPLYVRVSVRLCLSMSVTLCPCMCTQNMQPFYICFSLSLCVSVCDSSRSANYLIRHSQ